MATEQIPLAVQHQMAMARPWDHAEDDSIWEITGQKANGGGTFTRCLAMAIPKHITTTDYVVFAYVHPGLTLSLSNNIDNISIAASEVTDAQPLLLVHRDEPRTTYWERDQDYLEASDGD